MSDSRGAIRGLRVVDATSGRYEPGGMATGLLALLARGRRAQLTGLGALLVVSSAAPLASPQLLRAFIDDAAAGRPLSMLAWIAGGYVVVSVVQQVIGVAVAHASTHLAWVRLRRDRTLLVVSNRHATISRADQVIHLDDGRTRALPEQITGLHARGTAAA
jgi:ABC-type multidrug transport system fused ATPase/permease subunit